jgi:hypothetical protein
VQLKDDFEHALLELDFMEAGCAFGSIILALLTVPTAARSVWRLGLGGPAALAGLGSPTLRDLVGETALVDFLDAPAGRLVHDDLVLNKVGDTVYTMSSRGEPIGQTALSEIVDGVKGGRRGGSGGGGAKRGRGPREGMSDLQRKYADRTSTVYPNQIWAYIQLLEEKVPQLKRLRLRPWRRPRIADEWKFQEKMRTDQGSFSLVGELDGMTVQFDDLTPNGTIRDIKFRTAEPSRLVDDAADIVDAMGGKRGAGPVTGTYTQLEAEIVDQMQRQLKVAEELPLPDVQWETNDPAFQSYLENLVTEFGLDRGEKKIQVILAK